VKVLVADDSAVPRMILERTLRSLGHETVTVVDGNEAWAIFPAFQPDVILSDWLMPGMDGIELCRRIRAAQTDHYSYFVLVTAMTEVEHVITAMAAGADDFIVKPLQQTALEATLIGAARVTALHEELRTQRAALERLNGMLHEDARRDALTMIGNRLRLSEDLAVAVAEIDRTGRGSCIALLDIDHFKRYNDVLGHPAGDLALRTVGQALAGSIRGADTVYRYGGEEFLILLPDQTLDTATAVLERVRAAIENLAIPHPDNPPSGVVTISGGLALGSPGASNDINDWLRQADVALYQAKGAGRNTIAVFGRERDAA
jgi:two-component system cell cycle response regulator